MNGHYDIYGKATENEAPGAVNVEDLLRALLGFSMIQYDDS